jgi:hypothetical protein
MGGLLCPVPLVQEAMKPFLVASGSLGAMILEDQRRDNAVRTVSDVFEVDPIVARIRIDELYPAATGQMHL